MVFVLLACSDICGKKVNVTLPFENPPKSLEELYRVVEQVFRGEEKEMKQSTEGGNYDSRPSEPFTCRRIQRYDDDKRAWVEITNEKQLCACDQLYVFRKNATKADISQERELPEPRNTAHFYPCDTKSERPNTSEHGRPLSAMTVSHLTSSPQTSTTQRRNSASYQMGNSRRRGVVCDGVKNCISESDYMGTSYRGPECKGGPNISQGYNINARADKVVRKHVDTIYALGDTSQKGYLTAREFQNIFRMCHIDFPFESVDDIYRVFADERDGERAMTIRNFYEFAHSFGQTINIAYNRYNNERRYRVLEQEQRTAEATLEELQKQKRVLEERLEEVQRHFQREQDKRARMQSEADELRMAKDPALREEEQLLLDKEVSVFQYRKKLLQEEVDYEKLIEERRRRSEAVMGHIRLLPQTFNWGYSDTNGVNYVSGTYAPPRWPNPPFLKTVLEQPNTAVHITRNARLLIFNLFPLGLRRLIVLTPPSTVVRKIAAHVSPTPEVGHEGDVDISALRSYLQGCDDFFFSDPLLPNNCRLCGEVAHCGPSHTTSLVHLSAEVMMWLLFHKAKKHVSGAVGVSPCAANSFFTGEVKRWEKTLQLTSYSGRPLSHTTLTGRGGFEEPFSSLGTVTQDRNYPLKEGNSRCMAPGLRWHKAAREAAERLRNQIYTLNKLGILNVVDPLLRAGGPSGVCRDPAFQRMECIGDHNWGHSICHRILLLFPEVNWRMQSNILAMHALRSMLESNQHLSDVFTLLQLRNPSRGTVDKEKSVKFKADVVEAIAGELRVALWSLQPTASDGITARPSLHGVPYTPILVSMIEESLDALIGLVILAFMSKWGTTVAAAVIELIRREQYVLHTSNIHYKLHGRPARRSQRGQATCCVLPQPPPLLHEKRALPLEQGRPETPVRKWIPSDLSSEDAGKVRSAHTQRENELPKIPSHPPLAVPCPTATEVFVGETVEYYKLTDLKQQS